jgi:hypothetical protein
VGAQEVQARSGVGSEFRLQICGTTDKPRDDVHLGELVEAPKCAICFDLVKEVTPQG